MRFLREHYEYSWCLRCRLSGNRPRPFATPIPAQGGERELRRANSPPRANGFGAGCSGSPEEVRSFGETQFIERLKQGEASAFETLIAERSGEVYGLLYRLH